MELNEETKLINKLKQDVFWLKSVVESLCMTNFLVDYQEGDEEVREHAKRHINSQRRRIVDNYKVSKEHNELWHQQREIRDRMTVLEQDHPHLREL